MNVAFYEEYLPFTNFEPLLTLLEKEGNLDSQKEIVEAYCLDESCEEFVEVHGKLLLKETAENLNASNFFNAFIDGSTIRRQDREMIYVNIFRRISRGENHQQKYGLLPWKCLYHSMLMG